MSEVTPKAQERSREVEKILAQLQEKVRAGQKLNAEERLALFDANTRWMDELQAEQLDEAKAKGTKLTRENRGWTREALYEPPRGLPRGR